MRSLAYVQADIARRLKGRNELRLLGSEVAIGHLVIIGYHDTPSTDRLAVIVARSATTLEWRYLTGATWATDWNRRLARESPPHPCLCLCFPIETFGTTAMLHRNDDGSWVVRTAVGDRRTSVYHDGGDRYWREPAATLASWQPRVMQVAVLAAATTDDLTRTKR